MNELNYSIFLPSELYGLIIQALQKYIDVTFYS